MHIYFEPLERPVSFTDCKLVSLSWMGRVSDAFLQSWNDDQRNDENWKFNHVKYYEEGWLATGNQRGIIGVTYTSCKCPSKINKSKMPARTNHNLRGHRAEVKIVKWNEPFQKLATVDINGTFFIWIKYQGRWSIELINDREVQVVDFNWSHNGRMALIVYLDGLILICSVTDQHYWSSLINLESNTITKGIWSPDDQHVIIGSTSGNIVIINLSGVVLADIILKEEVPVNKLSWNCEKFKLDEEQHQENLNAQNTNNQNSSTENEIISNIQENRNSNNLMNNQTINIENENKDESTNYLLKNSHKNQVLAVCFEDGFIFLLKYYNDPLPIKINTKLVGIHLEWANKGDILAVGGHQLSNKVCSKNKQPFYINVIQFYSSNNGQKRYVVNLNYTLSPITALTWGHNDRRLFIATDNVLHIAWVIKKMPKLQLLSRLAIKEKIDCEKKVKLLQLPTSLRILIRSLFIKTLRCHLPDLNNLREFVINPAPTNMRYYCTLIRHQPKDQDICKKIYSTYVLYLEYLGGFIPILKGKRTSKLKPEFIIYDPQPNTSAKNIKEMYFKENSIYINDKAKERLAYPIAHYVHEKSPQIPCTSFQENKKFYKPSSFANFSDNEFEENFSINNYELKTSPSTFHQSFFMNKFCKIKNNQKNSKLSQNILIDDEPLYDSNNFLSKEINIPNNENNNSDSNRTEEFDNQVLNTFLNRSSSIFNRRRNSINNNLNKKLNYLNEMPEKKKILLITSNIWGTKFKFLSLISSLPSNLGCISYRTSLLHLQPRQMQFQIKELLSSGLNQNTESNELKTEKVTDKKDFFSYSECNLKNSDTTSDYNSNSIEDYCWTNKSIEEEDYSKNVSVAPMSPQFFYNSSKNHSTEFGSNEEYLTFQIDPNTEKINCNLTFSKFEPTSNYSLRDKICQQKYESNIDNNFAQCVSYTQPTMTNSVSTQTSFPTINNLCYHYDDLSNKEKIIDEDEINNTMSTLESCSRLIHSSSMFCPGKNGNQFKNEFSNKSKLKYDFTKRIINRNSLDLTTQRRLTLKANNSYLNIDKKTKCVLNCMYLDNEEEILINEDVPNSKNDSENYFENFIGKKILDQIHSSNESLLESQIFDDQADDEKKSFNLGSKKDINYENDILKLPVFKNEFSDKSSGRKYNLNKKNLDFNNNQQLDGEKNFEFFTNKLKKNFYSNDGHTEFCSSENDLTSHSYKSFEYIEKIKNCDSFDILSLQSENFELNSDTKSKDYINLYNPHINSFNQSLPATPLKNKEKNKRQRSLGKKILYSPIMIRKAMKQKFSYLDCSSDEDRTSDDDSTYNHISNLQNNKKKFKQKLRPNFCTSKRHSLNKVQPNSDDYNQNFMMNNSTMKELIMYNKAPIWNELSHVYQLDFGGRVTQESAKNFQIEFEDKQVLQFGRIDVNAYTLDFQKPFCALQALSTALANVTQRLK